jgi:hypothetical protein
MGQKINVYRVLVGKHEIKRPLGRPMLVREGSISHLDKFHFPTKRFD